MRRALSLLLFCLLACVAGAQWDDALAPQLEAGIATRAPLRGVQQARTGAFAAARLHGEAWRAEAVWHQSFRRADEHLAALSLGYEVWKSADAATIELRAAHRRFGAAPSARAGVVEHTTELGVRFQGAPIRSVVPALSYDRDLRRDADIVEARLTREFALTRWGAFLTTSVFGGWVDASNAAPGRVGTSVRDAYAYFGADARLPYRVGERTMLVLTAHASTAHGASGVWSALADASRPRAGLGLSVTFDF